MFSNHLPLLEIVMREDQVCTTSKELVVEDDDLVERVEEWEAFAENSKKTFLRHLVNQVQTAGTVDVALTGEYEPLTNGRKLFSYPYNSKLRQKLLMLRYAASTLISLLSLSLSLCVVLCKLTLAALGS